MNMRGFRRSLGDFKRHPWLHLISISTITIALFILGVYLIAYRNFKYITEKTSPHITGTVYLKDSLSPIQIQAVREKILSIENVQKVTFKTKESVIEELEEFLGSKGESPVIPEGDLFPDVLEINLGQHIDATAVTIVKNIIVQYPEVAEVDFSENWLSQFQRLKKLFRVFGGILMIALLLSCTFIIANFMGMRHQSRKNEIDIIRLMGAPRNYVLMPFVWEGLIEGVLGAIGALTLTFFVRGLFSMLISAHWASLLGTNELLYLSTYQGVVLVGFGMAMALLGSLTVFIRFQQDER